VEPEQSPQTAACGATPELGGPPRRGSRGGPASGELTALAMVVAVLLLPLVLCARFPTQDGPAHVENAAILIRHHDPGADHLRRYYTISDRLDPTWLGHLALAGLVAVAPPRIADKLFVTGYVIAFVAALWWALRGIGPEAAGLTFLGLPLVFNFLLHLGFYSFGYSVAAALVALGLAVRRDLWTRTFTLGLAAFVLFVWALHPISALVVVACTISIGTARAGRAISAGVALRRALLDYVRPPTLASLPFVAVTMLFSLRFRDGTPGRHPWLVLIERLVTGDVLVSYDRHELWIATGFVVGLGILALARRRPRHGPGLLLAALVMVGLYFVVPDHVATSRLMHAGLVSPRLALYVYLLLLFVVAAQPHRRRAHRLLQIAGAVVALALLVVRLPSYVALDAQLAEYLSAAPYLARGSTVLPLSFAPRGLRADGSDLSVRIQPFLHAAGWIAVERDLVEFTNYEAAMELFPVEWRDEVNPYFYLGPPGGHEETPPRVDLTAYEARTPGSIDAVLLWGPTRDRRQILVRRAILRDLATGWDLTYTSPGGLIQVYRRRTR
jgi:hypothetical protein